MTHAAVPSFIVKVCGITNEEDARLAIEAGANAVGMNFYARSPRFISVDGARDIGRSLPSDVLKVGVFVNASEGELINAAEQVPLDVVQLHGETLPARFPKSVRVWRSMVVGGTLLEGVEAYVLDAPTPDFGGSGRSFDWTMAADFPYRKIIAGGLDGANVGAAIHTTAPWGVDACSRLEARPGKKDARRVRDFVRAALAAMQQEVG